MSVVVVVVKGGVWKMQSEEVVERERESGRRKYNSTREEKETSADLELWDERCVQPGLNLV